MQMLTRYSKQFVFMANNGLNTIFVKHIMFKYSFINLKYERGFVKPIKTCRIGQITDANNVVFIKTLVFSGLFINFIG